MDFLGTVDEIGKSGQLLIVSSKVPDTGDPIFDSDKKKIGSVKRIFGPIDEPYISVALDKGISSEKLKGKDIYVAGRAQNGKDKRRNRRD